MRDEDPGTPAGLAGWRQQVVGLQRRSLAVGWLSALGLVMAVVLAFWQGLQAYVWSHTGTEHLPVHVPAALYAAYWHVSVLLVVVGTLAAAIMRVPWSILRMLGLTSALLVAALWWLQPPQACMLMIWPSAVERLAYASHDPEPAPLMASRAFGGELALDRQYLGAQVALRWQDQVSLARWVPSLLDAADRLLYDLPSTPQERVAVAGWSPEVIYRLDVALHGQPTSEIGLAYAQRPPTPRSEDDRPSRLAWLVCVAIALAGWFGRGLWLSMQRRADALSLELSRRESNLPG